MKFKNIITINIIIMLSIFSVFFSGCDFSISGDSETLEGPVHNAGYLKIGFTFLTPTGENVSSSSGYQESTYCKIGISKIELSRNSINFIDIFDGSKEIDLLDPDSGKNRIEYLVDETFFTSTAFTSARITFHRFKRDSSIPVNFEAGVQKEGSVNPLDKTEKISLVTDISCFITFGKTTCIVFEMDPYQKVIHSDPETWDFSLTGYYTFFNTMYIIPFSDPVDRITGMWTTGDSWGYCMESSLLNEKKEPIGSYHIYDDLKSGNFRIVVKRVPIEGRFNYLINDFYTRSPYLFFLSSNQYSGVVITDNIEEAGTTFFMNSIWPFATTGTMYNSVFDTIGTMNISERPTLFSKTGNIELTQTKEEFNLFIR